MTRPAQTGVAVEPLARAELETHPATAARHLLGALLLREEADGTVTVARIVETEAYHEDDPASHSRRRTARSEPMFWRAGTAYVYRSYGVHWCCNVTVGPEGVGAAVLLRAAKVLAGHEHVRRRRPTARSDRDLLRGPGRLTAGLDVDAARHDRGDLVAGVAGLSLVRDGTGAGAAEVVAGPRVGVRHAAERPWRFRLDGVAEVSPYRAHPEARRTR